MSAPTLWCSLSPIAGVCFDTLIVGTRDAMADATVPPAQVIARMLPLRLYRDQYDTELRLEIL